MKTVIIDYGMGNLHSVQKSVHAVAARAGIATQIQLTSRAQDILHGVALHTARTG